MGISSHHAYAPTIQRETSKAAPIDWIPLEPVAVRVNPMMLAALRANWHKG